MAPRKVAIVTGASGGLGLEFAKLLAAGGYDLKLVARSGDKLASIASSLASERGIEAEPIAMDLGVVGASDALFSRVPACDVLINNAGFADNGAFARTNEAKLREMILLDVLTLSELTRKYLPGMIERRSGKILNIASTAGFVPGPFMAAYYACKAYVISFSEALWEETRGSGVDVTCFCPGATATGFGARAGVEGTALFKRLPTAGAARVAAEGYRAMQSGRRLAVAGPIWNKLVALSPNVTPRRLLLWISRKMVETNDDVVGGERARP